MSRVVVDDNVEDSSTYMAYAGKRIDERLKTLSNCKKEDLTELHTGSR